MNFNKADGLYNYNEKKLLIDYIYSKINISKYKYKLLESTNHLSNFQDSLKYYVSPNFSGHNYLLVFCKIKHKNYNFMINRKQLSFNTDQIKYDNIELIPINIELENTIYNGTIIDGIYIKNDKKRENYYVITDIYLFRGISTENDKLNIKLKQIELYLNNNMKSCRKIIFSINKLYELDKINNLIYEDIKATRDFHVRGLSFYPEISGTKLIYVFNDNQDKKTLNKNEISILSSEQTETKNIQQQLSENKKYIFKIKQEYINNEIKFVLELRKTDLSDVYKLFIVEEVNKDNKIILKTKKLGIAYIPTKEISMLCKECFNKTTNNRLLFECIFHNGFNKWIPVKEEKQTKIPSKLNEILKKLDLIEEINNDSD
jgi:hypothetical protein